MSSKGNTVRATLFAGVAMATSLNAQEAVARDSNPGNVANFVTFLGNDASLDNNNNVMKGGKHVALPCNYLVKAFQTQDNGLNTTKFSITHRPDSIKDVVQYTGVGQTSYGSADIVDETDKFASKNYSNISVADLIADGVTPSNVEQMITQFQGAVCPEVGNGSTKDVPGGQPPPVGPIEVPGGCCAFAPQVYEQINNTKVNKITFDFA